MAAYFGIDLGTTQTLIAEYHDSPLLRENENPFKLIPIFYEKYRYDEMSESYRPNIENNEEYAGSRPIMPSVFYIDKRTDRNGNMHTHYLVGEAAQRRAEELDDFGQNYYTNAKARLEANARPDNNGIVADDITYEYLKTCFQSIQKYILWRYKDSSKRIIERRLQNIKVAVSTPLATNTDFSGKLLKQARNAAADVGFMGSDEKIRLIEEPTAALVNYMTSESFRKNIFSRQCKPAEDSYSGVAMVIDLGGGTSDVAIRPFKIVKKDKNINIHFLDSYNARSGANIVRADNARAEFGGMDFDDRIAAYLVHQFNDAYVYGDKTDPFLYSKTDPFDGQMQFRSEIVPAIRELIRSKAIRMAKIVKETFSDSQLEIYQLPDIYHLKGPEDQFKFSVKISRQDYKKLIYPLLEDESAQRFLSRDTIENIVKQTVQDAGLSHLSDLDFVYLTGGTSMMPEVRSWLKKYIADNCPIIWANDRASSEKSLQNCLTDIAYGVAWSFDKESGLTDYRQSLANAVMIDTYDGLPKVLIKAGTKCPNEDVLSDVFPVQSVVGIGIRLYSGIDEYSPYLRILGEYRMEKGKVIPPKTMLSFRYQLDADKQITLFAFYVDDRKVQHRVRLDLKKLS